MGCLSICFTATHLGLILIIFHLRALVSSIADRMDRKIFQLP
jgi:hypothetical protein